MVSISTAPSRPDAPNPLRSFFSILSAGVGVLLVAAIVGFFWLVSHTPLGLLQDGGSSPSAAMFVPKQAPVMVSLLVNPDRLDSFRLAVARPGDRRRARAELDRLKQTLLGSTGLTYEQDIRPWLGDEVTLAVTALDFDRVRENGQQPGYLLAVATQDPVRSREFLQLFWQKQAIAGVDLVFEQYAGVKIIYGEPVAEDSRKRADSTMLASAVVGDRFVLFANHPKVLRDAINNVQAPELSLSSTSNYQEALRTLPDRQVGVTFVNLPQVAQWLGEAAAPTEALANVSTADHLYESLMVSLQLERRGLVAETALFTAAGQKIEAQKPALSAPVGALRYIPATTPLVAAGVNLKQFRSQLFGGLVGYEKLGVLVDQALADLQTRWGLARSDFFDWAPGEFALSLIPTADRSQPDWVFVAEKSADSTVEIERLNTIAQQQGLSTGSLTLDGQTVVAWTKLTANPGKREAIALNAEVQAVRASVGNYEILATSVEAMNQALNAADHPLTDTQDFQQAIAPLALPNNGYFYADWQTVQSLVEKRLPLTRLVKVAGKPLFDNLRAIGVTSYGSEPTVQRGAVFLRLKNS